MAPQSQLQSSTVATLGKSPVSTYQDFLATKAARHVASGHEVAESEVHPMLFPFQRDLVRWSIRKGRAAIFADTGMGKTLMQLEWARLTGQPTLIVAPLSVARQTIHNTLKRFRSASPSPAPTATHRLRTSPPVTPRPAGTPSGVAS